MSARVALAVVGLIGLIALAGCSRVLPSTESPVPQPPGVVAVTSWRTVDPADYDLGDTAGIATEEAFLDHLMSVVPLSGDSEQGWRRGVLGRTGNATVGYLQQVNAGIAPMELVAWDARITFRHATGGTWELVAVQLREQCAVPVVNDSCIDNSAGSVVSSPAAAQRRG